MPVPDSSFSRRYGGREESSYSTYSSTRTTPSNRSSYLYNSKLSSTLPPRPTYERKISDNGMPVSRFLTSSTGLPRSSGNYISTTSSTRNLSPIRNSVSSYRSTFEGTPSVTDRIKSLEISGLDKDGGGTTGGRTPTTSRFLQKIREQRDASSMKPSSSYSGSSSRDRSGSREFGTSPLATSGMILRDRFGSENNHHQNSGDRINKFESRIRAASVLGRSSSPSSTSSYVRNGYRDSRLGSIEVTPTSTSSCSTTDNSTTTNNSSKSVPIVVDATNNAITTNNISAVAAAAKAVENGVVNFNSDELDNNYGQSGSSSLNVLENDNNSEALSASSAGNSNNISSNCEDPISLASPSPPSLLAKINSEKRLVVELSKNDTSNNVKGNNVLVENVRRVSKSNLFDAKTLANNTAATSSIGSQSPEKDSNGNTIIPIVLHEKSSVNVADKVSKLGGESANNTSSSSSSSNTKSQKNIRNTTDSSNAKNNTTSGINSNNSNSNNKPISNNNNAINGLTSVKSRRSSAVGNGTTTIAVDPTKAPKVIYHSINIEDSNNESLHHKQSSPPLLAGTGSGSCGPATNNTQQKSTTTGSKFRKSSTTTTESNNMHSNNLSNGNIIIPPPPPMPLATNNNKNKKEPEESTTTINNNKNENCEDTYFSANSSPKLLPNLISTNQNQLDSSTTCGVVVAGPANDIRKNSLGKVKSLINSSSKSRSPSPASPGLNSNNCSPVVLPSILNSSNLLVNGESSNHVDEMAGPHASKHLHGGLTTTNRPQLTKTTSPSLDQSSAATPMSSSSPGHKGATAAYNESSASSSSGGSSSSPAAGGSRQRNYNNYNNSNSSESSDNDSDSSSPNLGGGRYRSSRDKEKGLSGLRNIGNTCFMNSVLQCLSNTRPLLEYLLKENYGTDINTTSSMHGALMRAFASVIHELWSDSKSVVDTSAFKDQIQRFAPRFMGYSQQDAQEFLRYLLEGLHEDVNRVTTKPKAITTDIDDSLSDSQKAQEAWKRYLRSDDSKIVDLFVGQLKSTLKCTTCGHCSVTFDPFWDLSLPIPSKSGQTRLSQCLELFSREEILDGDEKPTCSKCNAKRKCTKSFSIQKFPKILVIHLKRFSQMERYRGKLSTSIDFPLNGLDMAPYAANRSLGCTYNLYGVSNHSGSTYSGHYIAYSKHPYSGEWYCYNDSRVSPISTHSVVSSDGYLLFYELAGQSSHL